MSEAKPVTEPADLAATLARMLVEPPWLPEHDEAVRAVERRRLAILIRKRLAHPNIAMGNTPYAKGCRHGLDHALHMVLGKPHPADDQ